MTSLSRAGGQSAETQAGIIRLPIGRSAASVALCCDTVTLVVHVSSSGVTGQVHLDENGDRETDFALWDMIDNNTSAFQIVLVYNSSEEQLTAIPGTTLQWLGGVPPLDVPVCGFKNDNPACLTKTVTIHQMVSIIIFFLFMMTLTITVFIYSCLQRGSNYGSLMTGDGNMQVFAKTGYYKGNIVAIKYTNRKRIELNRKVLFELKHMRDVQNEHLTRFIGACIDPPNTCIITEYCPRGSLQDILENDSITLDWMFKYSLINDIVKGMVFLHNSVIVSHGKLKSSNCVVDNRFVLKITDYGLSSFRSLSDCGKDAYAYYARQDPYKQPSCQNKGLEGDPLSPKEIVDRVVLGEWPCLRPTIDPQVHSPELGQLMQRCWAEEPTERPEFNHIRVLLRKQNKTFLETFLERFLERFLKTFLETFLKAFVFLSELLLGAVADLEGADGVQQGERHAGDLSAVLVPVPHRQPRHHHVGVADGLHLGAPWQQPQQVCVCVIVCVCMCACVCLALKIHVSAATRDVLTEFNCFQLERRGEIDVKGKGKMTTYWLLGESDSQ
ncbi:atrial natriuretic peptide receptor 2-like [Etheostoma cragini]|uniref:atrial natriuretic peptide receptor 2-like n=1 Tax=Etheostoma cragini TaxID=417921 RepID=UPI00155E62D3|nr:atrial natriuretic peptide receptor 2-like [Etheostoma cragini]